MHKSDPEVTQFLRNAARGDASAREQLFAAVEAKLRRLADQQMRGERQDHTLQATVLVDDAFMRLLGGQIGGSWDNRSHFYRAAARAMRNLLVDHARQRNAAKRGSGRRAEACELEELGQGIDLDRALDLHHAMEKLIQIDKRAAQVAELRYFGGRSVTETAEVLGVSPRTVKSDWAAAKAFLQRELQDECDDS